MTAIVIGIIVLLFVLLMGAVVASARKREEQRNRRDPVRRTRTYGTGSFGAARSTYPSNPNYDDGGSASYSIFTSDSSYSDSGGCDSGSSDGGSCGDGGGGGGD